MDWLTEEDQEASAQVFQSSPSNLVSSGRVNTEIPMLALLLIYREGQGIKGSASPGDLRKRE